MQVLGSDQESRPTVPPGRRFRAILPVVLAVLLFGLGVVAIRHLLHGTNPQDILRQARAMPYTTLIEAMLATIAGYAALVLYDRIALSYLGRTVPMRGVLLGGFLGYAIGNTIGVSVVSGGAVRYRVYSAFGLSALEVAGISTFVAMATGVGVTAVGLVFLALDPTALGRLLPLQPETIRFLSLATLISFSLLASVMALRRSSVTFRGIEIAAPSIGILSAQALTTMVDTGFAALALWFLLPEGAPSFLTFLPVFAAAMMAGVISHVPGGIGVFESVILAAMPADVPRTEVAAALLLFRGIYYLLPFAIAVAVVALNEARLAGGLVTRLLGEVPAPLRPVFDGLRGMIPMLVGAVSLAAGGYLLLAALLPTVRPHTIDPGELLGAILLEGGAALSAMIGVLLLLLSQGLVRRISGSFWILEAALLTGAVASALNDFDLESAALLLAVAVVLWPFRPEFHRTAKLTRGVLSPVWFALVFGIVLSCVALFLLMHEATPWSGALWTEFTVHSPTPRALRAGILATALLTLGLVWIALQPVRARTVRPDPAVLDKARAIVAAQDRPEACLSLAGDKALFLSEADDAFIAYAVQGKSWIAQGDPVGPPERVKDLVWDFVDAARAGNCRPAFYSVSDRYLGVLVEIGFTLHKLGEEAVVRLSDFSLSGGRFKTMRAAHNKALKSGLVLEVHDAPHPPGMLAELRSVSDAWLAGKTGSEKGFSVGRFTDAFLDEGAVATVRRDGRLLAFATILRPGNGPHLAVDLMRYLPEEASGMMEFLFVGLIGHFRDAGATTLSLGVAPLAGMHVRPGSRLWTRIGAMVFRHGGAFYNFEGLRAFKEKFQPEWQPRFLAVAGGASPLLVLKDAAVLISGGVQGLSPHKRWAGRGVAVAEGSET